MGPYILKHFRKTRERFFFLLFNLGFLVLGSWLQRILSIIAGKACKLLLMEIRDGKKADEMRTRYTTFKVLFQETYF